LSPSREARRSPAVKPEAQGFILAGGESSRMGTDKALVALAGRPLIEHSLAISRQAGLSAAIAGARSRLEAFAPVVEDRAPGRGPLAGVCSALASTVSPWAVILSIDLPLVPASLIAYMLDHAQIADPAAVVPSVSGFPQTFPAVVARAALPILEQELAEGRSGCFTAIQSACVRLGRPMAVLPVEMLAQSGHATDERRLPPALWFLNVNSPDDLERAGRVFSARHRVI
jgi:molybdenum cofactor guanylyltransferase